MRRFFEITISSFKIAMQELLKNKLRTFLSLFGVTIGIFCIIGVLATVNSLERNIQNEIKALGTNTIYIDKWQYGGGPDFPWWKFYKRPPPKYSELLEIKQRTTSSDYVAFEMHISTPAQVGDNSINNAIIYGISEDFSRLQTVEIQAGRLMSDADFAIGNNSVVIGNELAEKLFGEPRRAVGKQIIIKGKQNNIVGVIKKEGSQIVGGFQFDKSAVLSYKYAKTLMNERQSNPLIMVKGKEGLSSKVVKDELESVMRSIRKLNPAQDDNFALNDINDLSDELSKAFVSVNMGGWAIGALSFIVGIFGVANIMFVTVKERTSQIGLKKALGAKRSVILAEFLLESAFLCIIGGLIGLILVFFSYQDSIIPVSFPCFSFTGHYSDGHNHLRCCRHYSGHCPCFSCC
ncbi:MAG: ABC transporter permease [Flavisolibacter sp.]